MQCQAAGGFRCTVRIQNADEEIPGQASRPDSGPSLSNAAVDQRYTDEKAKTSMPSNGNGVFMVGAS